MKKFLKIVAIVAVVLIAVALVVPLATTTATASPPRRLPELRRSSLVLLVVSRDQKSPWMPLASPFPSSATEDRRRQIRRRSAFPELAVHLYGIHVSSTVRHGRVALLT